MQKFRLDWTFHSNAIEGNSLTYGETRAFLLYGVTAQGKLFKDYLDIKGHHQALDYLVEFVRQEQPLTEANIREIHKIVLVEPYKIRAQTADGLPTERTIQIGQYKSMPNHVITQTGETHYYATPEETPARMGDLMAWYRRERDTLHPLILAATFHYEFVAIHPFDDGNGRMARLLMNLILMQAGYPPVVIRIDNRPEYYLALAQADAGDLDNFITLVGNLLLHSLDLFLRGAKGENVDELSDLDKKLALLEKQLQTEGNLSGPEKDIKTQQELFTNILNPLMSLLFSQLIKFNRFFAGTSIWRTVISGTSRLRHTEKDLLSVTAKVGQNLAGDGNITEISIEINWVDFVKEKNWNLQFFLNLFFRKHEFEIEYTLEGRQGNPTTFITGQYNSKYLEVESQEFVKHVADEIYKVIEAKIKS
jgi:Fic family protein